MILVIILTAIIISMTMLKAYRDTGDSLHPIMFIGPMFLYMFVARPFRVELMGGFEEFFPDQGLLLLVQVCFTVGVGLFCLGMLHGTGRKELQPRRVVFRSPGDVRERLFQVGCLLGALAIAAYLYAVMKSGGFLKVYGGAKGHYSAGTGYINEMVNFAIPAVALVLLSWQGSAAKRGRIALAIFFSSPLLVHGILGARRGPTFLILATLLVAWYVASGKRITVVRVVTRFGFIGVLIIFLFLNRANIHLGSESQLDWSMFNVVAEEMDEPKRVSSGDDVIFTYGLTAVSMNTGTHYWGLRYAATYFIRPIPRQLWPNKYHDLGLGWMVYQEDVGGIPDTEWIATLGWKPIRGSAGGFIADLFLEFSWGALFFCYLFGRFYGALWRWAATLGGLWTLLYIQAAALSIYISTQSVSAVFHRFLFMTIPTILLWQLISPRGGMGTTPGYTNEDQRGRLRHVQLSHHSKQPLSSRFF